MNAVFMILNAGFIVIFRRELYELMKTGWNSDYYSYIPFIPVITAYLLYQNRDKIFFQERRPFPPGIIVITGSFLTFLGIQNRQSLFDPQYYLFLVAVLLVVLWIGVFTFCYGTRSARAAAFPLLFLFFLAPIPDLVLEKCILFLRSGSTEAVQLLFQAGGVPFARDGFIFHLPTLDIEVAKQCSGIRSALSLLITGLLAGYILLRTGWARGILAISIVPITILKNGFRIFVLSVLGVYVDEKFLTQSALHHRGGLVFFLLALALAGALVLLLRKFETRSGRNRKIYNSPGTAKVL